MKLLKSIFIAALSLLGVCTSNAQVESAIQGQSAPLKTIYINKDVSTHFVHPEGVTYVDLSVPTIIGDIPQRNTVRIKPTQDGATGVITLISERTLVQYLLVYTDDLSKVVTRYNIPYSEVSSYLNSDVSMTRSQLFEYGYNMYVSKHKYYNVSSNKFGARIRLNNIYTMDRYFFLDLSVFNKTNIMYDIEHIKFRIEDKKITKATNFQSIEMTPLLYINSQKDFRKKYRNVFVFDKFTFPEDKVLVVEISEKQISGRTLRLEIEYTDVLNADTFVL